MKDRTRRYFSEPTLKDRVKAHHADSKFGLDYWQYRYTPSAQVPRNRYYLTSPFRDVRSIWPSGSWQLSY